MRCFCQYDGIIQRMHIILGSTSPYKKQLLASLGLDFITADSQLDERKYHQATVRQTVQTLAELKAKQLLPQYAQTDTTIITTDVAGELDGKFLGKPADLTEAKQMVLSYSNRVVTIWCATTIVRSTIQELHTHVEEALVTFHPLTEQMVDEYIQQQQPLDKGGALAIEEVEQRGFIKNIQGERAAIIGLSLEFVLEYLQHN